MRVTIGKITIWFFRAIGITFGGLQIESNLKLSVNRFFRFYGYFVVLVTVIYETFTFTYLFIAESRPDSISRKMMPTGAGRIIMSIFYCVMGYEHLVSIIIIALLNIKG